MVLCGHPAHVRHAEQKILSFLDSSADTIVKYPIDLVVPATVPVYHREKRLILIMVPTPLTFTVCLLSAQFWCQHVLCISKQKVGLLALLFVFEDLS